MSGRVSESPREDWTYCSLREPPTMVGGAHLPSQRELCSWNEKRVMILESFDLQTPSMDFFRVFWAAEHDSLLKRLKG